MQSVCSPLSAISLAPYCLLLEISMLILESKRENTRFEALGLHATDPGLILCTSRTIQNTTGYFGLKCPM